MDRVKIVKASVDDIHGIAKVHVDSWKETYKGIVSDSFLSTLTYENREKQWKEAFEFHKNSDVWHMYVARNKAGEIIGFIRGGRSRDDKRSGEIYAVYLLRNCHGQGIGKSLMISSMQHLARAGFETCQVCVLKENPALHFYKKLGAKDGVIKPITIGTQTLDEAVLSWNSLLDALISFG
jgi:ribosomal protein S18 acetylase RimI-like enzyme